MSKTVTAVDTVHEAPQHSSSWRAIALCVDDYGLNDGVNQAVLALAQLGRVQAVSAMVGGRPGARGHPHCVPWTVRRWKSGCIWT